VSGTLVEQGTGNFGGTISVPAHGTWGGWISFHSPTGSGVFNKYDGREDMTIEIVMTTSDGRSVSGTITCARCSNSASISTAVAGEDFMDQEWADLDTAETVMRAIYERRDLTFDRDDRYVPVSAVGGYENIDSFGEFHDLLSDWSGPNTNSNIDAFIVQAINVGVVLMELTGLFPARPRTVAATAGSLPARPALSIRTEIGGSIPNILECSLDTRLATISGSIMFPMQET